VAGRPKADCRSMAGYGDWSELCRQPLLWLGLADATESVFEAMAEDPDRETLGRLLTGWHAAFGRKAAMVREAIRVSTYGDEHAELREVLRDIADERGEINRRKLGKCIKRNAGRIVDGLRFVRASGIRAAESWRVELVSSVSSVPDEAPAKSVTQFATSDSKAYLRASRGA